MTEAKLNNAAEVAETLLTPNVKLRAIRDVLKQLQGMIDDEIKQPTPKPQLQSREYEIGLTEVGHGGVASFNVNEQVPYNETTCIVAPGQDQTFRFGNEFEIKGSGIPGLPETVQTAFGMSDRFLLHNLVIDDACAEHFSVAAMYVGAKSMWWPCREVPATRFITSAPQVDFKEPVPPTLHVSIRVKNNSTEPRAFKAKLVGEEPVPAADAPVQP